MITLGRTMKSKEFKIFINALSVGWHLSKVMEAEPDLIKDIDEFEHWTNWLERHNIKKDEYKKK